LGFTLEDLQTKVKKDDSKAFREIIKDRDEGMVNEMIRLLCANAEIIGIDRELCYLIHDIFIDLAQKKMS